MTPTRCRQSCSLRYANRPRTASATTQRDREPHRKFARNKSNDWTCGHRPSSDETVKFYCTHASGRRADHRVHVHGCPSVRQGIVAPGRSSGGDAGTACENLRQRPISRNSCSGVRGHERKVRVSSICPVRQVTILKKIVYKRSHAFAVVLNYKRSELRHQWRERPFSRHFHVL